MRYRYWASAVASIILGLVFIFSGVGKLLHQIDFLNTLLNNSFLTTFLAYVVAYALPWAELILGALLIAGISVKLMASLSAVIVAGFVASNSWLIAASSRSEGRYFKAERRLRRNQICHDEADIIPEWVAHLQCHATPQLQAFLLGATGLRDRHLDAIHGTAVAGLPDYRITDQPGDGDLYQFLTRLVIFLIYGCDH